MMAGFERMGEMIMKVAEKQSAPVTPQQTFDPMTMMQGMLGMMVSLQQLMPQPKSEMDTLLKGIELAKDISGHNGDTTSSDVLLEAVRSFAPVIAQATTQNIDTENKHKSVPKHIPVSPTPNHNGQAPVINPMQMMLRNHVKNLVKQAQAGKDPQLYAELIMDNVPESQLLNFVSDNQGLNKLIELVPDVANHSEWFNTVITFIKDELTVPEFDDTNDTNPEMKSGNNVSIDADD
jgi:hypothetical protein